MSNSWEDVEGRGEIKEDWEQMLSSDAESIEASWENASLIVESKLSEEMKKKLELRELELSENLEFGKELLCDAPPTRRQTEDVKRGKDNADLITTKTGVTALKIASTHGSTKEKPNANLIDIDTFKPRTKEEFDIFGKSVYEKLTQYQDSSYYPEMISSLIRKLATNALNTTELRKLIGELQTSLNSKLQKSTSINTATAPSATSKPSKPSLKYGGSMKSGFDYDFNEYEDDNY